MHTYVKIFIMVFNKKRLKDLFIHFLALCIICYRIYCDY